MNPTGSRRPLLWACALIQLLLLAAPAHADNPVPRPPELERDVQFWIRV